MSTKEELAEARELIGLKVKEVSAVDRPANKRPFLVVKRRENNMSIFDSDMDDGFEIIKAEDEEEKDDDDKKKTEKAGLTPEMAALVKTMVGFMKKAMTAAGVDKAEMSKAVSAMEKLTDAKYSEPTSKASKQEEDEEDEEKGKTTKAGHEDEEEDEKKPPFGRKSKTSKSEDEPIVKINRDGSIELSGEITKGRVADAQGVKKILKLFGQTAAMLKDADPVTFQKAVKALAKGDLPKDPGFPSMVRPTEPPVAKSVGDEVTAAVTKALTPVTDRLDAIEKTRNGSSSLEDDGGTETKVNKNDGLWSTVLH